MQRKQYGGLFKAEVAFLEIDPNAIEMTPLPQRFGHDQSPEFSPVAFGHAAQ